MISSTSPNNRNINWIFTAIFTIILLLAIWKIRNILMLVFAASLLVILFNVPIRFLIERGIQRTFAILITVVGFIAVLILFVLAVFPTLLEQFRLLITEILPNGIELLIERWNEFYDESALLKEWFSDSEVNSDLVGQIFGQMSSAIGELGGTVLPFVGGIANVALSTFLVFLLSMYLLAEPYRYVDGVVKLTPRWYRHRMREILNSLDDIVRAWLRNTGIAMIFTTIFTGFGLYLIGIEQWLALAVLAGGLTFIPNFGFLVTMLMAITVGIVQAPNFIWIIIIIIYGVNLLESQLVSPILANENLNIPPLLILVGQIIIGIFFGFLGIMLAVPITAIFVVLVREIYIRDILGDNDIEPLFTEDTSKILPDAVEKKIENKIDDIVDK